MFEGGKKKRQPKGVSRRMVLGMLGASTLVGGAHYLGQQERKEVVRLSLESYAKLIRDNISEFKPDLTPRGNDLLARVVPPPIEYLQGGVYDPSPLFRSRGSWPAAQLLLDGRLRYVGMPSAPTEQKSDPESYGNSFLLNNGLLISNDHVLREVPVLYESISNGSSDIGAVSVISYPNNNKFDSGGWYESKHQTEQLGLDWDRRRAKENLHGKIIHIAAVHNKRGSSRDRTEVITGIAVSANYLGRTLNPIIKDLYLVVIPPRDVGGSYASVPDGSVDFHDHAGLSGSPIFTQEDCQGSRLLPSGIVVGFLKFSTNINTQLCALVLHGPKTIGNMVDVANTICGREKTESLGFSEKNHKAVVRNIQTRLKQLGFSINIDGAYGPQTERIVSEFQNRTFTSDFLEKNVIPGVVDRLTWNALFPDNKDPFKYNLLYR